MTSFVRSLGLGISLALVVACGGGGGETPSDGASGDGSDTLPPDDAPTFGLTAVFPAAASRTVDSPLTISGFGIQGTPAIHLTNCDQPGTVYDLVAGATSATSIATALLADPARVQGAYTVTVTNGDGTAASLSCALHILAEPPPTVTTVVPSTAWQGSATDSIGSDATVTIQGAGFLSTPSVRWVLRSNPATYFDAPYVGFVSDTRLIAVAPSETLTMPAGAYDVFVTNPDQLTAQWKIGATAGTFTVTATPPPHVVSANPARIQNGACTSTSIAIAGSGFSSTSSAWYLAPPATSCAGATTDANGSLLCPIAVDAATATAITGHFPSCPALGPYPLVVVNADGQSSYWFSLEVTPSSDGHLNVGSFENVASHLEVARWKHAAQFGFDAFSNALVYVAGGQGAQGTVLGSVEVSRFDLFGTPGPFHHVEQFGGASAPRTSNDLNVPRAGATLVRVGASLFAIGGSTARSDTTTVVAASTAVERAEILGFGQMPGMNQPAMQPQSQGLPSGAWYYQVSAVGPWGESLAARERVAIRAEGQIQVCWQPPAIPGAVSYNIYRSLAADGRAGTAAAIAYEVAAPSNCWIDTGTGASAPAPGNARGTLASGGSLAAGTYRYRISAVVPLTGGGTRETYAGYATSTAIGAADVTAGQQTISLAWDALPIGGATYRVYRLDPTSGTYKLVAGGDGLTAAAFADSGVAFASSVTTPVAEIRPLPPGSLSRWDAVGPPQLQLAREGLDGVVVQLDPAIAGGLVARILVAGGRDGATGSYAYRTSAESLGVYQDGTTDASWSAEGPGFAHARGYYALLTTQNRNETPFPPPPEQPPCNDCGGILLRTVTSDALAAAPSGPAVTGGEPVYIVAALGDDAFSTTGNTGRSDFESCAVDMATGHLAADCGVTSGTTWVVQSSDDPQASYGHDALLYFSFLYPFYGVKSETVGAMASTIQLVGSAIARFPVVGDLASVAAGQVLQNFQSASTSFIVRRSYYQMTRLLAYVYVIGGFAEARTENSVSMPAGPTTLVERHQQ